MKCAHFDVLTDILKHAVVFDLIATSSLSKNIYIHGIQVSVEVTLTYI